LLVENTGMTTSSKNDNQLPISPFSSTNEFEEWLEENHKQAQGIWLKLAKKGAGIPSITYDEAVDVALCYGWIDSQKKGLDADWWLQKFTPRRPKSIWSKRNREKIEELMAADRMQPAGLSAVEEAQANGQWHAAYDSPKNAAIPEDFQNALDQSPQAKAFYETLNSRNTYAILYRIQNAKKAETRRKRIRQIIEMLEKKEKLYP
jgi:uncharacterized protein YdeI (YjbR/CyaY-like superfamily)